MEYTIKAHPTPYAGVRFRSRLEARWAAFFDLMGWDWAYEPIDLRDWVPDFYLSIPCFHSDRKHELYVEVKPFREIEEFLDHPVAAIDPRSTPSPAMFGLGPECTEWQAGPSNGCYSVLCWGAEPDTVHDLWKQAGNVVQWRPSR